MLTQKDIDELETRFKEVFLTKDEFKLFKSDLFDKLDSFLKEVRDSHQERIIVADQLSKLDDRVTNLEAVQTN